MTDRYLVFTADNCLLKSRSNVLELLTSEIARAVDLNFVKHGCRRPNIESRTKISLRVDSILPDMKILEEQGD